MEKKVAIALGGGGAKFFAHLGMIEILKKYDIPINYFSCSSMGSIAGALISNEVPIKKIKNEFYRHKNFLLWFKPSFKRLGLLSQDCVTRILDKLLPQTKIENSKIPFSITSSNILDGKLYIFKKGNIKTAVNATCAFPGLFPPVKLDGKMLVDGGILNNIPADICRKHIGRKNIVISSSLDASLKCKMENIKNSIDIYQRIIYLPMYEKRLKIVNENSDFFLNHFSNKTLSLISGQDIFKVINKKSLETFYEIGKKTTLKKIDDIKNSVKGT